MRLFFLILIILIPLTSFAQVSIEGEIRDSEEGRYLPFAHVRVAGSGHGTAANSEGHFRLDVDSLPVHLTISYVGYQSAELEIAGSPDKQLLIKLQPSLISSEELIVTDDYEINMLEKAAEQILSDENRLFSHAFYRQVTMVDTIATEFIETFYGAEVTPNHVERWKVENGRYAVIRRDSIVFSFTNTNFSTVSKLSLIDTPAFRKSMVWPLRTDMREYYNFYVKERLLSDEDSLIVLQIEPKPDRDKPLAEGTVVLNENDYSIRQLDVTVSHPDFNPLIPLRKKDKIENVLLKIIYNMKDLGNGVYVPGLIEVSMEHDYIRQKGIWPFRRTDFVKRIKTSSILFLYDYEPFEDSALSDGNYFDGTDSEQTDYELINQAEYDPEFWKDNPVIKRTPVEESIIQSFEKYGSFGRMFNEDE